MYQGSVAKVNSDADAGGCKDQEESAEASPQVFIEEEAGEDQGGAHGPRQGLVFQSGISPEPYPESKGC